mmetsp:Transcript_129298/g.253214  ORF Transcript_129298/g.253214 Transcript_129298/m.253214 type:complete len:226 (+) Transcript_129298:1066-1743(+)
MSGRCAVGIGSIVRRMQLALGLYPGSTSSSIHRMISSASSSSSERRSFGTSLTSEFQKAHATHSSTLPRRKSPIRLIGHRSVRRGLIMNQPQASARLSVMISASSTSCSAAKRSESVTAVGTKSTLPAALFASDQSRSSCSIPDSLSLPNKLCRSAALGFGDILCPSFHACRSGMLRLYVMCGSANLPPVWMSSTVSSAFRKWIIVSPGGNKGVCVLRPSSCQCL